MRETFLPFNSPLVGQEEIKEVIAALESGRIAAGPRTARFEQEFAAYKDARHIAALSSCTSAPHLSLLAADIGPGNEVVMPPLAFCSSVNAVIHAGATPVFADIDPVTMNIDPDRIEEKITPRTRAILPMHFAGRPCDMNRIIDIAHRHNLTVIEDCAHAVETEYQGRKAGTLGDFGCFSFSGSANIVAGEGGAVLAKSREHMDRIKILGLHGQSPDAWNNSEDDSYNHYRVTECGYKCNMTELQAALALHQITRVETWWRRRREIWNRYSQALAGLSLTLPAEPEPDTRHGHHLYTILVDENHLGLSRDAFLDAMTKMHIGVAVHYPSLPEHPYYQRVFGWRPESWPHAMRVGRETVSLPLSPKLSDRDVADVIEAIHSFFEPRAA